VAAHTPEHVLTFLNLSASFAATAFSGVTLNFVDLPRRVNGRPHTLQKSILGILVEVFRILERFSEITESLDLEHAEHSINLVTYGAVLFPEFPLEFNR
jgi:hypothetical protein